MTKRMPVVGDKIKIAKTNDHNWFDVPAGTFNVLKVGKYRGGECAMVDVSTNGNWRVAVVELEQDEGWSVVE